MSEASIRTIAWREQKRQEGYQPVTIWIPAPVKSAMVNLSFQRHQDLSELIVEAFQAWIPAKGGKAAPSVDLRQVEALVDRKLAYALATQHLTPSPPAAPETEAPPALPPAPAGMKQCGKGHAPYRATKPECPQCVRERKKASRERRAAERRGEVPA
jgi:hypothetical protein